MAIHRHFQPNLRVPDSPGRIPIWRCSFHHNASGGEIHAIETLVLMDTGGGIVASKR